MTVSHEHSDHNYVAMASGSPRLMRGLWEGRAVAWAETVGAVQVIAQISGAATAGSGVPGPWAVCLVIIA